MAPPTPLEPTPAIQKPRGVELTPVQRGYLVRLSESGLSDTKISEKTHVPRSTVRSIVALAPERPDGVSKPRSGRPRACTARDERVILRYIRRNPKATCEQILRATNLGVSSRTIARILKRL